MILRTLCPALLLAVLASCDGASGDDAPDSQASKTAESKADSAPAGRAVDKPRIPAFVREGAPASDSSSAIRSVYSSLGEADCRLLRQDEETGGTTSRCPGTAGYALLVHDDDARMSVDVVAPGGRTHPLRYWAVITSNFSSLGPRAEWRMRGGIPIAIIVRVNAFENPEIPDRATSYLAVAKITPRGACVTDRIPPTAPNANEAARQAADRSASRPCMRELGS